MEIEGWCTFQWKWFCWCVYIRSSWTSKQTDNNNFIKNKRYWIDRIICRRLINIQPKGYVLSLNVYCFQYSIQLYCHGHENIKARGNNTSKWVIQYQTKFLGKRHSQSLTLHETKPFLFNWEKLASSLTYLFVYSVTIRSVTH